MFVADVVNSDDVRVGNLDPLDADTILAQLPRANDAGDTRWLIRTADGLVSRCAELHTADEARAALRDLGFVVSSIGRHDPEALNPCPWENELVRLGAIADEVPRDTVYSYAPRNPTGERRRTFTASAEERLFISSVTDGIAHLNHAVETIAGRLDAPPADRDESLARLIEDLGLHLRRFAECLLLVKRNVTPGFFTSQLRPYYPPIRLGDEIYYGPGGAQMPQLVLDVVLLRPDRQSPYARWHDEYVEDNSRYLPPAHRKLIKTASGEPAGLIASVAASHALVGNEQLRGALRRVLSTVLRFRYPHQQLARANMRIRPPGSVGSGGYSLDAVDRLVDLTSHAIDLLDERPLP